MSLLKYNDEYMKELDLFDKAINAVQFQLEELGLMRAVLDEYNLTTEQILEYMNVEHFPSMVTKNKLSYYVQHKMIPAPKRVSFTDKVSGSQGKYKVKVAFIIWYIEQLRARGIKSHDDIRSHIYTYFSDKLPPKPVEDTPLAERIIYTYRVNKRSIYTPPVIKEISLPLFHKEGILDLNGVTLLHLYKGKPVSYNLVLNRSITPEKASILKIMRKDKEFLSKYSYSIYTTKNNKLKKKKLLDLHIFKDYPIKTSVDNNHSYIDFLDQELTYESI